MKKIIYSILTIGITVSAFAQEAAESKVQAGLVTSFGTNFQKMGTKRISTNGNGSDMSIGANVVINFSETVAFCTGAEFDFEKLKYKSSGYESKNSYYYYNDTEIINASDVNTTTGQKLFQMTERTQKAVYLTLPTMLVFRTKFFGTFRYFGKFGLRNSFLLSNKITDEGFNFPLAQSLVEPAVAGTNENMKAKNDMVFFKSAVGLALGSEWNFSGTTCLNAEIGYYYGFTPLHADRNTSKGNNYFFASGANVDPADDVQFNNKATQGQVMFKLSILF